MKKVSLTTQSLKEQPIGLDSRISDGFVLVDENGIISTCGGACAEITGIPCEDMIGQHIWDIQHAITIDEHRTDEQYKRVKISTRKFLRTGKTPYPVSRDTLIQRPDGVRRFVYTFTFAIPAGKGFRIAIIFQDVTDREQTGRALIQNERRFWGLVEHSRDGIYLTDEQGRVTGWNRAQEKLTGLEAEEVFGKAIWDIHFRLMPREYRLEAVRKRMCTYYQNTLRTGEISGDVAHNYTIEQPSGERRHIETEVFTISTASGWILSGIMHDVTERREIEEAERRQRVFSEALLDTAVVLNSTLNFDQVIDRILTNVERVVLLDSANIMLVEGLYTYVIGHRGYRAANLEESDEPEQFQIADTHYLNQMFTSHQPIIIGDIEEDRPEGVQMPLSGLIRSYIGVPILLNENVIGFLNLGSFTPHFFTPNHAQYLQIFSYQAAVAIQNAQAYEQAQELAAYDERQRLARNLHDAVTQTIFSASVLAESMPQLWQTDPQKARKRSQQVYDLTRGALAELRTLLLELRPDALLEADLPYLLQQLGETLPGQMQDMTCDVIAEGQFNLPDEVKVAFYRIAQEATNNIIKHSRAHAAFIKLEHARRGVMLRIADDGRGMDLEGQAAGQHMGLKIMAERAEEVSAKFQMQSRPGEGTQITLTWSET
jgi:two-component system nitrate/nitrite sensor histidine kinase NarX